MTSGLASVPTYSTLLSALWPGHHAILDIRDYRVIVALLATQDDSVVPPTALLRGPDWRDYRCWFRDFIVREGGRLNTPVVALERALFVAHDLVDRTMWSDETCTWADRGKALLETWRSKAAADEHRE